MRKRDPISTPARRRRIIADHTKVVLRNYFIKACDNVRRLRLETASAICIQGNWKCYLARKRLKKLRRRRWRKAAKRIQAIWRMKLAILLRHRLAAERHHRRCKRLARVVEDLWSIRKARLYRVALLVQRQLVLVKLRQQSAIKIQKIVRGRQDRKYVKQLKYYRQLHFLQRKIASTKIQKTIRRFVKRKQYLRWKKHKRSVILIRVNVKIWWRRCKRIKLELKIKQQKAAIKLQSFGRMILAKKKLEELRKLEEERLRRLAELAAIPPPPPSPRKEKIDICVHLSSEAMMIMANKGPVFLLHWCLGNGILRFHNNTGYLPGSVIAQVIRSVEIAQKKKFEIEKIPSYDDTPDDDLETSVMSIEEVEATNTSEVPIGEAEINNKEKVITVAKWEKGSSSEIPNEDIIPQEWQQHCQCPNDMGDEIYFVLRDHSIEVHILALRLESSPTSGDEVVKEKVLLDYCIQFLPDACLNCDLTLLKGTHRENIQIELSSLELISSVDDAKLRFKDALVTLYKEKKPIEPPPEPTPMVEEVPQEEIKEVEVEAPVEEVVEMEEEVFHIILEEEKPLTPPPTPPPPSPPKPPPIDYDAMASIIQKPIRERYRLKYNAAIVIQQVHRRRIILRTWQQLVNTMWDKAQRSRFILQCAIRQFIAKCRLWKLRREHEEENFPFGHDFSLNETRNWESFGFDIDNLIEGDQQGDCPPLFPVIQLNLSKQHTCFAFAASNPFLEVVDILQISESMPTNCLVLNSETILLRADPFETHNLNLHSSLYNVVDLNQSKSDEQSPVDDMEKKVEVTTSDKVDSAQTAKDTKKEDSENVEEDDEGDDDEEEDDGEDSDEEETDDDDEEETDEEDNATAAKKDGNDGKIANDPIPTKMKISLTDTKSAPEELSIVNPTIADIAFNYHSSNIVLHRAYQQGMQKSGTTPGMQPQQIAVLDLPPACSIHQEFQNDLLQFISEATNGNSPSMDVNSDLRMIAILQSNPFYRKLVSKA